MKGWSYSVCFCLFFSVFSGVKWKLMNGWQDLLMTSKILMTSNWLKIHINFFKLTWKKKSAIFKKINSVFCASSFSLPIYSLSGLLSHDPLGKYCYRTAKWTCLDRPIKLSWGWFADTSHMLAGFLDSLLSFNFFPLFSSWSSGFFSHQKTLFKYLDLINRIIQ